VLWNGKKIAGAAQRRNKLGLLIQGSVQPPPISPARADWENAMRETAQDQFNAGWDGFLPDVKLRVRAKTLADEKFSKDSFNRKR
jgi:hypothetical protein